MYWGTNICQCLCFSPLAYEDGIYLLDFLSSKTYYAWFYLLFPNVNCLMAKIQTCNTNVTYNLDAMRRTNFIPTVLKNTKYFLHLLQFILYLEINAPPRTSVGLSKANGTELYFIFLPCFYGTLDYHEKFLISYCGLYWNFTSVSQNSRKHLKESIPWV